MSSSTVFSILYYDDFNQYDFAGNNNVTVWYYDGTDYGSGVHGFLLFLAVMFAVFFVLPYAILLTFSHYLMRFRLINKFRPFFDAYGGPFKDKWKIWFGLRLWITAILLSVDGDLQGTKNRSLCDSIGVCFTSSPRPSIQKSAGWSSGSIFYAQLCADSCVLFAI